MIAPAWGGWTGRDGHSDLIGSRDKCDTIQMVASMYGMNVLALHMQDAEAAYSYVLHDEGPRLVWEPVGTFFDQHLEGL